MQFSTQEKARPEISVTEIEKTEVSVAQKQINDLNGSTSRARLSLKINMQLHRTFSHDYDL